MENAPLIISAISVGIAALSAIVGVVWRLSAKIYTVEIWARDEFVRKGSFEIVIARMEKGFTDLRSEISGRLDKVSEKIDNIKHS